ncbi:MAG: trypsin-like serine protease, partial [Myxococcota bacterium]|nr:trypsin-like serine protease [Myxococcota bacterium]
ARHCVAQTTDGPFSCTPEGDLVVNGTGAGQIGANDPPSSLAFFTNTQVMAGTAVAGAPATVGASTISTNTPTSCRDDLAFVVLKQPIMGVVIAPVRIDSLTSMGEIVSVWGYGLTGQVRDALALRVRYNAQIVGVGPDVPVGTTQPAPVRAVRLGPDDITCAGDSGGPITSAATGAVIAIASLGNQPNRNSPSCSDFGLPDTTGPRLAAYTSLAQMAFAAAGASPVSEYADMGDASSETASQDDAHEGSTDDASAEGASAQDASESGELEEPGPTPSPDSAPPDPRVAPTVTGGSCGITPESRTGSAPFSALVVVVFVMAIRSRRLTSRRRR